MMLSCQYFYFFMCCTLALHCKHQNAVHTARLIPRTPPLAVKIVSPKPIAKQPLSRNEKIIIALWLAYAGYIAHPFIQIALKNARGRKIREAKEAAERAVPHEKKDRFHLGAYLQIYNQITENELDNRFRKTSFFKRGLAKDCWEGNQYGFIAWQDTDNNPYWLPISFAEDPSSCSTARFVLAYQKDLPIRFPNLMKKKYHNTQTENSLNSVDCYYETLMKLLRYIHRGGPVSLFRNYKKPYEDIQERSIENIGVKEIKKINSCPSMPHQARRLMEDFNPIKPYMRNGILMASREDVDYLNYLVTNCTKAEQQISNRIRTDKLLLIYTKSSLFKSLLWQEKMQFFKYVQTPELYK